MPAGGITAVNSLAEGSAITLTARSKSIPISCDYKSEREFGLWRIADAGHPPRSSPVASAVRGISTIGEV